MKERVFKYGLGIGVLFGFLITSIILFGVIWFWELKFPLPYRISQPVTQPASTPADNGELTARVENLENDQNFNLKAFEWKLDQKLLILGWVALFISFAAGFMGIKTYKDLDKVIKEKVDKSLEKELYQLDPTNLPIHLYKGRVDRTQSKIKTDAKTTARDEMTKIADRLSLTGLQNVGGIKRLDKVSRKGITVIPIDSVGDEEEFVKFVSNKQNELDYRKAGFILYAPDGYRVDKKTLNAFQNVVTANMPPTVANMVLVIGRGMKNRDDIEI